MRRRPASPAGGATLTPTAQTTTGGSANVATFHNVPAVVFQVNNTAGTSTVEIDICCMGSCDPVTGAWAQVAGSPMTMTAGSTQAVGVANPTCQYRSNATACTACSFQVGFACAGP